MPRRDGPSMRDRIAIWSHERAPPLHRFLTSERRAVAVVRSILLDVAIVLGAALLLGGLLWGATGQSFPDAPVVVVESGSMMHCANGLGWTGDRCDGERYGRFGTIDPGDLIFVRDVDRRSDVATFAAGGKARYGDPGDVIIFYPEGDEGQTPIIHRAMFWLQIHGDGTYSVPELGIERADHLNDPRLVGPTYRISRDYHRTLEGLGLGPEDSGFVTRGDNNNGADQTSLTAYPVKPEWILGKARGEVPWLGLVKLWVWDLGQGKLTDGIPQNSDYENAPSDVRQLMWVLVAAAVTVPWGVEWVLERRRRAREGPEEDPVEEEIQEVLEEARRSGPSGEQDGEPGNDRDGDGDGPP